MALARLSQSKYFPRFLSGAGEKFPPAEPSNAFAYLPLLKIAPLISIVMPVFNSRWLKEAAASVLGQSYRNFELILVDDASSLPMTLEALAALEPEPKIRIIRNPQNLGISGATNAGIAAALGEYVAFMDHDDLIHPDALACFARTLNDGCDDDVFYTNEMSINSAGVITGKILKGAPSMDLLLSCNAVNHFCIMKKESLLKIGLLNPEFDGAQDHDLMLRALEHGLKFRHIPCCLYAWRTHHLATSGGVRAHKLSSGEELPKAYRSGKKAIRAYLERNHIKAEVTDDAFFWYRVKYSLPPSRQEVAMIIPFRDQPDCLRRLMASLQKTACRDFRVFLVNNQSRLPETQELLSALERESEFKITVIDFDEPFNYSRLHNRIVAQVPNEILLFMNNDLEVTRGDWLEAMLEHIYRPGVGAVGCRLLRPTGEIQHAGMTFRPDIYFCAMNFGAEEGYFTRVQREVAGVTCACMLTRKSVFEKIGGFDEVHFPIGFSDADLCLKIRKAGYRIIYTPFAELIHHESLSRKTQWEGYEKQALFRRYIGATLLVDEHYRQG